MTVKEKLVEILKNKKFIKDENSPHYPENKVLLVKGISITSKPWIEIGLSDYCAEEYADAIIAKGFVHKNDVNVWEVGVSDCESSSTLNICSSKEIALREMFEYRDVLVNGWKNMIDGFEPITCPGISAKRQFKMRKDLYEPMIKALSGNDYKKWNNYPHDTPWIKKTKVIIK